MKSELFGNSFEHFMILEVRAYNSYLRKNEPINYWRSTSQFEVDLIIGGKIALEVKATQLAQDKHLKGLRALKEEKLIKRFICVTKTKLLIFLNVIPMTHPFSESGIRLKINHCSYLFIDKNESVCTLECARGIFQGCSESFSIAGNKNPTIHLLSNGSNPSKTFSTSLFDPDKYQTSDLGSLMLIPQSSKTLQPIS